MKNNNSLIAPNEYIPESGLITIIPDTPQDLEQVSKSWDTTPAIVKKLTEYQKSGVRIDFLCLSKTNGKDYPKCEICTVAPDGSRQVVVLKQIVKDGDKYGALKFYGIVLSPEVTDGGKKKCKSYIAELYKNKEGKFTQMFLAHLFGVSQSTISKYLKKEGIKRPKR